MSEVQKYTDSNLSFHIIIKDISCMAYQIIIILAFLMSMFSHSLITVEYAPL